MPTEYRVRLATIADVDILVRHRILMFTEMGVPLDAAELDAAFRAWLVEDAGGAVAGGGGITIIPWPPGPRYVGDRLAFVYNVYTEAAHRRRGLARQIMNTIHDWCRAEGISSLALNASRDGQPLYESMGYAESSSPMMFLSVVRV